jgi:hypothetical protein
MVDEHRYRQLALALPEAVEAAHMGHPDFRVGGKIFATLWPSKGIGVAMLTPEQQEIMLGAQPDAFSPAAGAWGRRGSTVIALDQVEEDDLATALRMAWRNRAPKALVAELDASESE